MGSRLLRRLLLGARVRLSHELLPARPAEHPDDEDEREDAVPRGDDDLLAERVGGGVGRARDLESETLFTACVTPTPPGVNDTLFAREFPPTTDMTVWKVTGML